LSQLKFVLASALAITCLSSSAFAGGMSKPKIQIPKVITAFNTMYGVSGPFVGPANPVRGIAGDDTPWASPSVVEGRLSGDGFLFLLVRGLVFSDDDVVPPDQRGVNPDDTFRGLVSCLTEDGDKVVEQNVITKEFKADAKGNSLIVQKLELPNPCVAPVVMVLDGDRDVWFAMTGNEVDN
jgi:hypothetical protein